MGDYFEGVSVMARHANLIIARKDSELAAKDTRIAEVEAKCERMIAGVQEAERKYLHVMDGARAESEALRKELAEETERAEVVIESLNEVRCELAAKDARIAELEAKTIEWMKVCTRKGEDHFLKELHCSRAETEALRRQLAEFGAGEDTTTMTRKSFAEVLQALADVKKELADMKRADWKVAHIKDLEGQLTERRDRIDDLDKELSASRKWNQDLLDAARETRPDDDRCAAEWGLAVFAALKKLEGEFEAYKVYYEYDDVDLDMAVECEVKERDAARKELAEAKAVLARVGVCMSCWNGLSMYEQGCTDCLNTGWRDGQPPAEAALEDAKSRIAELEERNRDCRDAATRISGEITARAARAEAELAQVKEDLHYANGTADLAIKHRDSAEAECKAMREALQWIETKAQLAHNVNHVEVYAIHRGIADKACAALGGVANPLHKERSPTDAT